MGTPYSAVHFSSTTVRSVEKGLKASEGNAMQDPCVADAMYPSTDPKQWNNGGGQQIMSDGVRSIRAPIENPLFRMERCVREAALGSEVVPEVNCIFMMSVFWRS